MRQKIGTGLCEVGTSGLDFRVARQREHAVARPPQAVPPVHIEHISTQHLVESGFEPRAKRYLAVKPVLDFVLGLVLLVVTAPVTIVAAILVKLTSRGPAFYRQVRLGQDGQSYSIYKLRTMVDNAEAGTGPVWCRGNDPRITRVGAILRSTHIDEFPQLLNVLRGEMSLIGPRPERPEIAMTLECSVRFYGERLRVKPGITGLAQVRLPADTDIESVRRKLVHDLYYVNRCNLWLDLQILVATGWQLVSDLSGRVVRRLSLPARQAIETGYRQVVDSISLSDTVAD